MLRQDPVKPLLIFIDRGLRHRRLNPLERLLDPVQLDGDPVCRRRSRAGPAQNEQGRRAGHRLIAASTLAEAARTAVALAADQG